MAVRIVWLIVRHRTSFRTRAMLHVLLMQTIQEICLRHLTLVFRALRISFAIIATSRKMIRLHSFVPNCFMQEVRHHRMFRPQLYRQVREHWLTKLSSMYCLLHVRLTSYRTLIVAHLPLAVVVVSDRG